MLTIILLTVGGFVLILIDLVFLPGLVMVAAGTLMILYSVYLNFLEFGFWAAFIHLIACLAVVPKLVTWSLGRVALKQEMKAEDGFTGVPDRKAYVGMRGKVLTPLRPSGTVAVVVDGQRVHLDCISESGYLDRGTEVVVLMERGPSLVVGLARESEDPESPE